MSVFVTLARKMGIDGAIAYSSGSRIVGGLTGVLSVFFITTFLTGVEQGFYYTFGSILAMQVFFELGLTGIMTQFVAHEASHLFLNENCTFEGEKQYKSRLASLVRFCVKWYSVLALLVFVFLLVVGYVYFYNYGSNQDDVNWQIPWILICVGTAFKLFQSPFNSILMGIGKVKEMSKIGFWQQIILPLTVWIGLATGLKLFVVGISYLASVVLWQVFVHQIRLDKIIIRLWKEKVTDHVSYLNEIFPFQWRIALSWVSGYFLFQLFNPVLFATEGAVVAGQMGMTLTAINAIQAFSMSWMSTKVPLFSQLIAQRNYEQLDQIFSRSQKQMANVCFGLLVTFFAFIWLLNYSQLKLGESVLADRFLTYLPMLLVALPMYLQQYIYSWATYLRCHKQEPLLCFSIVCGVVNCLSTLILGRLYGLYGVTIGYCVVTILSLPWSYLIYKTKKIEWHK
jgi:O-antigen/teichoic acid export membrane protein